MNNLPLAFLMGLLGSLHCAIMCGPLMLSLPLSKKSYLKSAFQLLLYQFGRIFVYTLMGFFAGWLGNTFSILTNQHTLSVIIGVILITSVIIQLSGHYNKKINVLQFKIVAPISKLMGKLFNLPLWGFFAGFLNGLIPCGMVYLALATALSTATSIDGSTFMFLFGIGTTPLMLMISLGGIYLKKYINFNTKKLIPYFMLFMGTLFILRSAALGIPFLSPILHSHQHQEVTECK